MKTIIRKRQSTSLFISLCNEVLSTPLSKDLPRLVAEDICIRSACINCGEVYQALQLPARAPSTPQRLCLQYLGQAHMSLNLRFRRLDRALEGPSNLRHIASASSTARRDGRGPALLKRNIHHTSGNASTNSTAIHVSKTKIWGRGFEVIWGKDPGKMHD
jgi:hypothetical protein